MSWSSYARLSTFHRHRLFLSLSLSLSLFFFFFFSGAFVYAAFSARSCHALLCYAMLCYVAGLFPSSPYPCNDTSLVKGTLLVLFSASVILRYLLSTFMQPVVLVAENIWVFPLIFILFLPWLLRQANWIFVRKARRGKETKERERERQRDIYPCSKLGAPCSKLA